VEATDPDDADLWFNVSVLAASRPVSLLRVVKDGLKTASVFLNAPLNAVVRSSLTCRDVTVTSLSQTVFHFITKYSQLSSTN